MTDGYINDTINITKGSVNKAKEKENNMYNIIETVNYYEALRRFSAIKGTQHIDEIVELTKRTNDYIQQDKINRSLLDDLCVYGKSIKNEEELVICIQDLIYSVGNDDQTRIDIKINEGYCYYVTDYAQDTITLNSFGGGLAIRMKKNTFRYYFGVINYKGKSFEEFIDSKIFKEMEKYDI